MRAKLLLALFIIPALLFVPAAASAATQTDSVSLQLQGAAQVDRSQSVPQLLLSADATDNSGYHLDVAVSPTSVGGSGGERREGREGRVIGLGGQFTLTQPGASPITGDAAGQLGSNGVGALTLTTADGSAQLNANFVLDSSGNVEVDLAGQVPAAASSAQGGQTGQAAAPQQVNHTFWYLARAAGLSAYLMLFINVVLGLAVHTRFMDALTARWRSLDLHEFTALLALGLLAVHGLALVGDQYVGFTLPQVLLPVNLPYRPFWTAMGIIAFYLLVAVTASSYIRKQLGYRAWRAIHFLSFVAFIMGLAHGVMAGTDTTEPWARAMYMSTGAFVLVLTVWRFGRARHRETAPEPLRLRSPAGQRSADASPE